MRSPETEKTNSLGYTLRMQIQHFYLFSSKKSKWFTKILIIFLSLRDVDPRCHAVMNLNYITERVRVINWHVYEAKRNSVERSLH